MVCVKPVEEARYALDWGLPRSDLKPEAQVEYDRLAPEHRRIQQVRREAERRKVEGNRRLLAVTIWFPGLGVAVRDGNVYVHATDRNRVFSPRLEYLEHRGAEIKLLGPLAGAHAEVVAGKTGKRRGGGARAADAAAAAVLLGPAGLLAAASRAGTGLAVVTFADGSSGRGLLLRDQPSLTRAQTAAVQFNALAASGEPPRPSGEGAYSSIESDLARLKQETGLAAPHTGVAAELERLAALHASGVLDDEEFRLAKARLLGGMS
jgi:Short C-terminal domain